MSTSHGFLPIATTDARILILGSMPGRKSLEKHQYYAHPQNCFWQIMFQLLDVNQELTYSQKKKLLVENRIALWDVLASCCREGSLDSKIDHSTIKPNDFNSFFATHKQIKAVFFNGSMAEQLFKKHIVKNFKVSTLEFYRLPSTSPAHAAMTVKIKLNKWNTIKKYL